MRNPNRIPKVLQAFEEVWTQYPDIRFWQILPVLQSYVNAVNGQPQNSDLFYLEDDEFLKILEKYKEELKDA